MRVFLAAQSQWRYGPSGRLLGLDYRGARAAAKGIGVRWRKVFDTLRVMEYAVLEVQGEAE